MSQSEYMIQSYKYINQLRKAFTYNVLHYIIIESPGMYYNL